MNKIAIAGYGLEGEENYRYFSNLGYNCVIVDENSQLKTSFKTELILGEGVFKKLQAFDMVVRTAGLNPNKIKTNGQIWSATNEFFAQCPAPIIGVTGTKGKGTTSSLIASILTEAGKKVHLVGNIGVPALAILPKIKPDDIVVYELSSFQLWDLQKSPQVAVVLMIEADHLDVHANFQEYLNAKSQIATHQIATDTIFYHPTNQYSAQIAQQSAGRQLKYNVKNQGCYIIDDMFYIDSNKICATNNLHLVGSHNLENACAAISASWIFSQNKDAVKRGLAKFKGLDHRLKFIAEVNHIKYYDDSIATTEGSAIAALNSFEQPKTIILGGSDKGSDYRRIIKACQQHQAKIIAIGQTGHQIYDLARESNLEVHYVDGLMDQVVKKANQITQPNSVVILSPASASFGQYLNYKDRGQQFIKAVQSLYHK